MITTLRSELKDIPLRMLNLPIDERGYPVPWFVEWIDGKPEFRAASAAKWLQAVKEKRCWVCGQRLGAYLCFVLGPMCGVTRTTSEPPCHRDCARWSARFCPFLARPHMIRRGTEQLEAMGAEAAGGILIQRNPGVTLLWYARDFKVWHPDDGGVLITVGDPTEWEWWAEGRKATRAEVDESIRTGLPNLEEIAHQQEGGMEDLQRQIADFQKYLP
jgi:hypothetical protein